MLEALWTGLVLFIQWPAVGFLLIGCLLGDWIGAAPGLASNGQFKEVGFVDEIPQIRQCRVTDAPTILI